MIYVTMAVVALVLGLAFWKDSLFLYIVSGPMAIVYGLELADDATAGTGQWVAGIVVSIIGVYCLVKAVLMGFDLINIKRSQ